jgi:hypothetical protein
MNNKLSCVPIETGRWSIVRGKEGEVGRVELTPQGVYFAWSTKPNANFDASERREIEEFISKFPQQ